MVCTPSKTDFRHTDLRKSFTLEVDIQVYPCDSPYPSSLFLPRIVSFTGFLCVSGLGGRTFLVSLPCRPVPEIRCGPSRLRRLKRPRVLVSGPFVELEDRGFETRSKNLYRGDGRIKHGDSFTES